MEHNGYKASIKKAPKLKNIEGTHSLPPGESIEAYPVDAFKEPLPAWIKGAGNFVVPVDKEWGLWFDWTRNDPVNTAVLPTVKGMNPITGQKTEGFGLEKYKAKCPVHGVEFKDGLFCEECNYKWPYQNFVSFPNHLWWDGFRAADGTVRQFLFTEDLEKSIPELVLGKGETIPAFGFAFYATKNPRKYDRKYQIKEDTVLINSNIGSTTPQYHKCYDDSIGPSFGSALSHFGAFDSLIKNKNIVELDVEEATAKMGPLGSIGMSPTMGSFGLFGPSGSIGASGESGLQGMFGHKGIEFCCDSFLQASATLCSTAQCTNSEEKTLGKLSQSIQHHMNFMQDCSDIVEVKEVGIGAGAKIRQELMCDNLELTEWTEQPLAVMRIYFIFMDQFKDLSAKGMKDLVGNKDGFLHGLPNI